MLKGRATDITDLLITSVANNISMIILGKKFEYTDPAFLNIKKILRIIPVTNSSLVAYNFIPWLKYIPGHSWFFPQHNVK